MKVLVTGGAGYIGSFMTKRLLDLNHDVIVFDSLERGYKEAIDTRAKFVQGDIRSPVALDILFRDERIDTVMHFAGYISVGESMEDPQKYYKNNTEGSKNLIAAMMKTGKIDKFIFSSSAAVYGNPSTVPIPEDHPKSPTNPYGRSKLQVEKFLESFQKERRLNFVSLRYFNAAGAALDGKLGENHEPETHIIPLAIKAALNNSEFSLYGTDYNTPDGTCIRDYIHVIDLVEAHVLALEKLVREKGGHFYNVGTGEGYTNKEVLDLVEKVGMINLKIKIEERRRGDAEQLIADPTRIQEELGFRSKYSDLETIVKTAWEWHRKLKMKNEK